MDNSNIVQIIGYIAIAVIIVSVVSIGYTITGQATNTNATVNVTIESLTSINFTFDNINFGSGTNTLGQSAVLWSTNGTVTNGNYSGASQNFTLQNIGNNNVTVRLASRETNDTMIGGTSPAYFYRVWNATTGCNNTGAFLITGDTNAPGGYHFVNTTAEGTLICNPLEFEVGRDSINISIVLVIPADAAAGAKSDKLTAIATAA